MIPGAHFLVRGQVGAILARARGMHLRDAVLILGPGLKSTVAHLLRSPLQGSVAETVLVHEAGTLNVDACRVGQEGGRWPSNLVLVHQPSCVCAGTRKVKAPVINRFCDGMKPFGHGAGHHYVSVGGGVETIPVWKCGGDCAVQGLDEQSFARGIHGAGNKKPVLSSSSKTTTAFGARARPLENPDIHKDTGGASRFFPQLADTQAAYSWLESLLGYDANPVDP